MKNVWRYIIGGWLDQNHNVNWTFCVVTWVWAAPLNGGLFSIYGITGDCVTVYMIQFILLSNVGDGYDILRMSDVYVVVKPRHNSLYAL